jgi:hypothetical protein
MMMRRTVLLGAVVALLCLPTAAVADWEDDFEAYDVGSGLHGQGGWKCWDSNPIYDAFISNAQSHSPEKSVDIISNPASGDCDMVHEYSGYDTGQWTYTAWQYIPTDFDGIQYFILLSDYSDGGPYAWAVQIEFDSASQRATSTWDEPNDPNYPDYEGPVYLPLITGRWVELRTEIDLDADWFRFYYDNELLAGKPWTAGPNNDYIGSPVIDAVDLYANFALSSIYYDDMSLTAVGDCPGDIDGDGETGHADLGLLLSAWCSQEGDSNWNPDADLDGDGHVGHGDLGILLADWGCGT